MNTKQLLAVVTAIAISLTLTGCLSDDSDDSNNPTPVTLATMDSIVLKGNTTKVNYHTLTSNVFFNGGTLGDGSIDITIGGVPKQDIQTFQGFLSAFPSTLTSQITQMPTPVLIVTHADQSTQSYIIDGTNYTVSIPASDIKNGKNTITVTANLPDSFMGTELPDTFSPSPITITTYEFVLYKGSYDQATDGTTTTGKTAFTFNVKAGGTTATDMMVAVNNTRDTTTTTDDEFIMLLPDSTGVITVSNLQSTGGHRIDSEKYERWIVAPANGNNSGQGAVMSYNIDLRQIADSSTAITGTFKKIDDNSNDSAVPFTTNETDVWLHAHYTHPTATYTAVCAAGFDTSICPGINENNNIYIGTTGMHTNSAATDSYTDYSTTDGSYSIRGLAGDVNYGVLVFWLSKNIDGINYPVGTVASGTVATGMDITVDGRSKALTGDLNTIDTHIRIARKVLFNGQPFTVFSDRVIKNGTQFTINFAYDIAGITTTYLLWGISTDALDTIPATCDDTNKCRSITISATSPIPTELTLP